MTQQERMKWFTHDRFGLFIHWGLYAIPARGEWVRSKEHMPIEDYQQYFDEFNPEDYDPAAWAKAAKNAGMKYAVLTAKHHDGFCLFDSALTDYKSTNTPCKLDLVREYVDAFRAEGLKVGFYYSLLDWHHPDYPHHDGIHPMRESENHPDEGRNFDRYVDYLHGQVRELCSNYGKIDILFFDFSYGEYSGEKWRATELLKMAKELQPHIIVNNRLEGSGHGFSSIIAGEPTAYAGDYVSPEQMIPQEGVLNKKGEPVYWEANLTMNNNWGYAQFDKDFYPPEVFIRMLVECVSKGGNLLMNVGPDAMGNIPPESLQILQKVGEWMSRNQKSIYGCGPVNMPKPDYGRFTGDGGKKIYIHVTEHIVGPIPVKIKKEDIKRVRLLATGAELSAAGSWASANFPEYTFIRLDAEGLTSYPMPDKIDTVIMVELK